MFILNQQNSVSDYHHTTLENDGESSTRTNPLLFNTPTNISSPSSSTYKDRKLREAREFGFVVSAADRNEDHNSNNNNNNNTSSEIIGEKKKNLATFDLGSSYKKKKNNNIALSRTFVRDKPFFLYYVAANPFAFAIYALLNIAMCICFLLIAYSILIPIQNLGQMMGAFYLMLVSYGWCTSPWGITGAYSCSYLVIERDFKHGSVRNYRFYTVKRGLNPKGLEAPSLLCSSSTNSIDHLGQCWQTFYDDEKEQFLMFERAVSRQKYSDMCSIDFDEIALLHTNVAKDGFYSDQQDIVAYPMLRRWCFEALLTTAAAANDFLANLIPMLNGIRQRQDSAKLVGSYCYKKLSVTTSKTKDSTRKKDQFSLKKKKDGDEEDEKKKNGEKDDDEGDEENPMSLLFHKKSDDEDTDATSKLLLAGSPKEEEGNDHDDDDADDVDSTRQKEELIYKKYDTTRPVMFHYGQMETALEDCFAMKAAIRDYSTSQRTPKTTKIKNKDNDDDQDKDEEMVEKKNEEEEDSNITTTTASTASATSGKNPADSIKVGRLPFQLPCHKKTDIDLLFEEGADFREILTKVVNDSRNTKSKNDKKFGEEVKTDAKVKSSFIRILEKFFLCSIFLYFFAAYLFAIVWEEKDTDDDNDYSSGSSSNDTSSSSSSSLYIDESVSCSFWYENFTLNNNNNNNINSTSLNDNTSSFNLFQDPTFIADHPEFNYTRVPTPASSYYFTKYFYPFVVPLRSYIQKCNFSYYCYVTFEICSWYNDTNNNLMDNATNESSLVPTVLSLFNGSENVMENYSFSYTWFNGTYSSSVDEYSASLSLMIYFPIVIVVCMFVWSVLITGVSDTHTTVTFDHKKNKIYSKTCFNRLGLSAVKKKINNEKSSGSVMKFYYPSCLGCTKNPIIISSSSKAVPSTKSSCSSSPQPYVNRLRYKMNIVSPVVEFNQILGIGIAPSPFEQGSEHFVAIVAKYSTIPGTKIELDVKRKRWLDSSSATTTQKEIYPADIVETYPYLMVDNMKIVHQGDEEEQQQGKNNNNNIGHLLLQIVKRDEVSSSLMAWCSFFKAKNIFGDHHQTNNGEDDKKKKEKEEHGYNPVKVDRDQNYDL